MNLKKLFALSVWMLLPCGLSLAEQLSGTLRGTVTDESGALIPGATVTVAGAVKKTVTTDQRGAFVFVGLTPGHYSVTVESTGFAQFQAVSVDISAGRTQTLNIPLRIAVARQEVTVTERATVSTDPSANAGALVLKGEDLQALSDDPDDLAADLQALAGPSAGPNGGQIFIDGFTGGRLPPKESIREIRINQNPFSAEYDRLGYGRIEIFTKPGTDKFRGQTFFNFSDAVLNSRNPYAPNRPPFQSRMYGGNLSGPITKRASFFVDLERREIDDNAVINSTILDNALNIAPFSQAVVTPHRYTTFSPRLDYQINTNNTLVARYTFSRSIQDNSGIGEFSLLSRAYNMLHNEHTFQLTETAVLSPKAVNETRLQLIRNRVEQNGDNSVPTISVLEAFTGGGAQIGQSFDTENRWELQNNTSLALSAHTVRFGVRLRGVGETSGSPQNFGGTFQFSGGQAPQLDINNRPVVNASGQPVLAPITSIERYRRTLLFQQQGLTPAQIRALGGGATQFSIAAGNPLADVSQVDAGIFAQDDWRVRPNFTLSLGLRYETQNNIHDWTDLAPRIGLAWAPGSKGGSAGKTVFRGGFGVFYDRFNENLTLQAIRFNGSNQQQFTVSNPDFFPAVPSIQNLVGQQQTQTIRQVDTDLRAPYILQSAAGIERQLPFNTMISFTYTNSRGVHMLRSRDINAPLPGTFVAGVRNSGARPYGDIGNIFLYESTGFLNQNQFITNLSTRFSRRFTVFTGYFLNYAKSDTDGAQTSPADPYNLRAEYGRSSLDVRHRFIMGGSIGAPWGLRFSPFIIARSGSPFNITSGRDANGDTLFLDRPALATDLSKPGVVLTRLGAFDPNPGPGELILPRNYGQGPGYFSVNIRLSKTVGFGTKSGSTAATATPSEGGGPRRGGFGGREGGREGDSGGMRMGGGPRGGGGRGGGGFGGFFGDAGTEKRYNLTFSISARNLFNHTNPGPPIGNVTSLIFGESNALAGGFGPERAAANNRRIELQMRFSF